MSDSQLRALVEAGLLRPADLVWREGMPEWIEAGSLPGLFPTLSVPAGPPPLPLPIDDEDDRKSPPRRRRPREDEEEDDGEYRRSPGKARDEPWSGGVLALFIVCTVVIPLVGLIMGAIDLSSNNKTKRSQGGVLLGVAVFMIMMYVISLENRHYRYDRW